MVFKMVKTDYGYQTKRISHRRFGRVIQGKIQSPADAKVVCLPGKYAREIKEVYDLLGFKRKNIVGIERDREVYEYLRDQNLGIELYFGEDTDFFSENPDRKFEVVSLDYTGLPSREGFRLIRDLFINRHFASNSILHTNYYASRINVFSKVGLPYVDECYLVPGMVPKLDMETLVKSFHFWDRTGKNLGIPIKQFRSDAITSFLVFCSFPNEKIVNRIVDSASDEEIQENLVVRGTFKNFGTIPREDFLLPFVSRVLTNTYCDGEFHLTADEFTLLFEYAFIRTRKAYSVEDLRRFEYVSDDGSLMFTDILHIRDNEELLEKARRCVKGYQNDSRQDNLIMNGSGREYARNKKCFEECAREYKRRRDKKIAFISAKTMPPRVDITPRRVLDTETALRLLNSGWTYEMFEDEFKDVTPARIAAYKAHRTMGTYDEKAAAPKEEPKEEGPRRQVIGRGIIVFDSNHDRLRKNLEKIDFGENEVDSVSVLRGVPQNPGITMREKKYGLYILNTSDPNSVKAFEEVALRFCESPFYLNVLLIGGEAPLREQLEIVRELGAKVRTCSIDTPNGYLQAPKKLEELVEI